MNMRILVVDDDPSVLRIIAAMLRRWDYEVTLAHDGAEAWAILQREEIRLVISDWMMPGLTGPELCCRVRATEFSSYVYFILLTGREDKPSLIQGMDAGADDFMVKPVYQEELRVRVRAGERILRLEAELGERNRHLNEINRTLSEAYATIRHDLESAAAMQKALLPPPLRMPGIAVEWLFQPSSFVAGDMFDYFKLGEEQLSFYQLDVAGHGVPAALLSFTLSRVLSGGAEEKRLRRQGLDRDAEAIPRRVVAELNQRFQSGIDPVLYFTMIYGNLDLRSGRVTLTQAGHPRPICLRHAGRRTEMVGGGGFPVGMLPEVEYETLQVDLAHGDRLFLYSDGITECASETDEMFSEQRLRDLLEQTAELPAAAVTECVGQALREWKGDDNHQDDVTLLILEREPWP
ncbi:MAG: SpoIIE family protein phosphatase [Candidatus Competibacter sp.]|nr:SpoIIE family protein phosphatase [Candidatus Competibacter sp.]MDG4583300.1 SpoIIE family protein phosphatase [Candidatus Competibacter sp.]